MSFARWTTVAGVLLLATLAVARAVDREDWKLISPDKVQVFKQEGLRLCLPANDRLRYSKISASIQVIKRRSGFIERDKDTFLNIAATENADGGWTIENAKIVLDVGDRFQYEITGYLDDGSSVPVNKGKFTVKRIQHGQFSDTSCSTPLLLRQKRHLQYDDHFVDHHDYDHHHHHNHHHKSQSCHHNPYPHMWGFHPHYMHPHHMYPHPPHWGGGGGHRPWIQHRPTFTTFPPSTLPWETTLPAEPYPGTDTSVSEEEDSGQEIEPEVQPIEPDLTDLGTREQVTVGTDKLPPEKLTSTSPASISTSPSTTPLPQPQQRQAPRRKQ